MLEGLPSLSLWSSLSKIALFLGVWLLVWLPFALPLAFKLKWQPFQPFNPQQKLPLVALLYGFAPLIIGITCYIEGKSLKDYGLPLENSVLVSLLLGIICGTLGILIVFGLESWGGWVQWRGENWKNCLKNSFPLLLIALWVGITEEFIFRGLFVNQLQENYSPAIAASLSSLIFAVLHLIWERKETFPQLPGLWLMGMILVGMRYLDGGNLGLAWGLHTGWVWGLASLDASEMLIYPSNSPQWITGIYRQPLAGMGGILCLLATGIILWQVK